MCLSEVLTMMDVLVFPMKANTKTHLTTARNTQLVCASATLKILTKQQYLLRQCILLLWSKGS